MLVKATKNRAIRRTSLSEGEKVAVVAGTIGVTPRAKNLASLAPDNQKGDLLQPGIFNDSIPLPNKQADLFAPKPIGF